MILCNNATYSDPYLRLNIGPAQGEMQRLAFPGQTSFDANSGFQHEQSMCQSGSELPLPTTRLNGAGQIHYLNCLDFQLSELSTQALTMNEKLDIAICLSQALQQLHSQHILHLGLRPSVLLCAFDLSQAQMIDLSHARLCQRQISGLTAFRPRFCDPHFLAPEQCYPQEKNVDVRTDLYALGCVLFWLFFQRVPFQELKQNDQVFYAQAAKSLDIPATEEAKHPAVCQIISALTAKEPENRYQSCAGLLLDLQALRQSDRIPEQAQHQKLAEQLTIPQQLYGREAEQQQMLQAFDNSIAGHSQGILIAGYSGVGKTALVQSLQAPIICSNGIFIQGKFDQYKRSIPYSAFVQAFRCFSYYLLSLAEAESQQWRERLNKALAPNTQIIIDLLPDLELLLGSQPEVTQLGPDEQLNRFNQTFLTFIREICLFNKPLTIFIDDLQWADAASLALIDLILHDRQSKHCLLIGAYRDNEVDSSHPFAQVLNDIKNSDHIYHQQLSPLTETTLQHILIDTLQQAADAVKPLAQICYQKTAGNPFFFRQFLQDLYQSDLLRFDHKKQQWQWQLADIEQQQYSDNVVDLMLKKIDRLAPEVQQLLQLASCIGASFSLDLLQAVSGLKQQQSALQQAIDAGLICPVWHNQNCNQASNKHAKFLHDRVQQAAYSLLNDEQRQQCHLQLALNLHHNNRHHSNQHHNSQHSDDIFELVAHYNQALSLLTNEQRLMLAELNFEAAQQAKQATAYKTAVSYLRQGFSCCDNSRLKTSTILHSSIELCECLYLSGEYSEAEEQRSIVETLLRRRPDDLNTLTCFSNILITQYTRYGELNRAIEVGLNALTTLGFSLPPQPDMEQVGSAIAQAQQDLARVPFAKLVELPEISQGKILLIMDILMAMQPCCYNSGSLIFPLTILSLLRLTHEHGNSPYSSYVFMMYGLLCTKVLKDYNTAFSAAQHSDQIAARYPPNPMIEGRLAMMRSNFILPWQQALEESNPVRKRAYQQCVEQGDYYWGVHAYIFGFYAEFLTCRNLRELQQHMQSIIATCQDIKQPAQVYLAQLQLNLLAILQGQLDNLNNLDHQPGYEDQALQHFNEHHYMCGKYDRLLGRLLQGYLFNRFDQALAVSLNKNLAMDDIDEGIFHEGMYTLLNLLTISAIQLDTRATPEAHWLEWQQTAWQKYQQWHDINPQTFACGYYLVQAEQAALEHNIKAAILHYEDALEHAEQAGFALLQGIAYERYGLFRVRQQQPHIGASYIQQAQSIYSSWGAQAKARQLETILADFRSNNTTQLSSHSQWQQLVSSLQHISGALDQKQLSEQFVQQCSLITGAQVAVLVTFSDELCQENVYCHYQMVQPYQKFAQRYPEQIFNYVANTGQSVVINNSVDRSQYGIEIGLQIASHISLLSLPVYCEQMLVGVLYLESGSAQANFSEEKLQVIKLLSLQFSSNAKNRYYFNELQKTNHYLEQQVNQRTEEIRDKNEDLEAILNALPIPYVMTRPDGHILRSNQLFLDRFAIADNQVETLKAGLLYKDKADREAVLKVLDNQGHIFDVECQMQTTDGTPFWTQFSATRIKTQEQESIFAALIDISSRKEQELRLHQQASTDALTGCLNRRAFYAIPQQVRQSNGDKPYCLAMLDLDHFKKLNDTYGHACGDRALIEFVNMVRLHLREGDMIGRLGGEEFALFLNNIALDQARQVLERIRQHTEQMVIQCPPHDIAISFSGGLLSWEQHDNIDQALKKADQLLYIAKEKGRNRVEVSP